MLSVTAPSCPDTGQFCSGAAQQQLHPLGPCSGKHDRDRAQQVMGGTDIASILVQLLPSQMPLELHISE